MKYWRAIGITVATLGGSAYLSWVAIGGAWAWVQADRLVQADRARQQQYDTLARERDSMRAISTTLQAPDIEPGPLELATRQ